MAATAEQYKALIIEEVGDSAGTVVARNIDVIWDLYSEQLRMYRQYLLAKRKALHLLMGTVREQVDQASSGNTTALTDKMRNLKTMLDDTNLELDAEGQIAVDLETNVNRSAGALGQLTTTSPCGDPGVDLCPDQVWPLRTSPLITARTRGRIR